MFIGSVVAVSSVGEHDDPDAADAWHVFHGKANSGSKLGHFWALGLYLRCCCTQIVAVPRSSSAPPKPAPPPSPEPFPPKPHKPSDDPMSATAVRPVCLSTLISVPQESHHDLLEFLSYQTAAVSVEDIRKHFSATPTADLVSTRCEPI